MEKAKTSKMAHYMVVFCGFFLLGGGIYLPIRHFGFDGLVAGIVVAVLGLSTLILFGPNRYWAR